MFLIKYNRIVISSLMIVLSFLMVAQVVLAVSYDPQKPAETTGLNDTAGIGYGDGKKSADLTKLYPTGGLPEIIGKIVGAALSFLGVVFFILIIYGGYMWMASMGNEQTATKAKDIIIAAVIGLVIVLAAYAITSYIGTFVVPSATTAG